LLNFCSIQPLNPDVEVAVTFTADQFGGIYREGKQYHQPDYEEVLKRAKVILNAYLIIITRIDPN
jgi:hypothetical protein